MIKKTLLTFSFICSSLVVLAQGPPPPPPPGLPIDGGIIFLVISGLIYGIKKLRD